MDNNSTPNQPQQPVAAAPQPQPAGVSPVPPTTPQQPPSTGQTPAPSGDQPLHQSKKMILMLAGGLVLVLVLVGGTYLFVSMSGTGQEEKQTQAPPKQDSLETELNQVNIEDLEENFATVEADLQNL